MDAYFMKNSKTASSKLDNDLDSYFLKRGEKKKAAETGETKGGKEAPTEMEVAA
jgi:hypothetical protein